eukprot:GHVU01094815.1.p1 GENE.GHVU01094815.1~~GHVU01094815.1.p1  ORF type:complete len:137 (-),score=20.03 GHVU01094815.1:483-893(-)
MRTTPEHTGKYKLRERTKIVYLLKWQLLTSLLPFSAVSAVSGEKGVAEEGSVALWKIAFQKYVVLIKDGTRKRALLDPTRSPTLSEQKMGTAKTTLRDIDLIDIDENRQPRVVKDDEELEHGKSYVVIPKGGYGVE